MEFRPADAAAEPAAGLIEAMIQELIAFYGRIDGADAPSATPRDFQPPGGVFLVGWDGDDPVAGGGVKRLDAEIGEIKRMYVVPERRGTGLGKALLAALEEAGGELGYTKLRLDTGIHQPGARHIYETAGYREIENYNANPHASFWGEKTL